MLGLLCAAAFLAGTVDAIAGGGGLITVPALLATGLPPQTALGTNKGQSVFGAAAALVRFRRAGLLDGALAAVTFPAGLVGSALGATLVLALDPALLRPLVMVLLLLAGAVVLFRRSPPPLAPAPVGRGRWWLGAVIALCIGAYDGFFGPGTGTFLIIALVSVLGRDLPRAAADAKVVNFASNLAAVALFAHRGAIVWAIALPMAAAQFLGGLLGAQLAVRGGAKVIRGVLVVVVLALVVKLLSDLLRAPPDGSVANAEALAHWLVVRERPTR